MVALNSRFTDPISRHAQALLDPVLAGQILERPEDFGGTPGIFPSNSRPARLPSVLSRPPAGTGSATNPNATRAGPSIADLILGQVRKLGPVGRGVDRVLSPVADFAGEVGEAGRRAARTGALAGLAPSFTQGVMQADQNDLNRRLIESSIGLNSARAFESIQDGLTPGSDVKASTDRGKANQDLRAGIITPEEHAARISEIDATETRKTNKSAADLRGERDTVLKASNDALQSLRAAESLLQSENPFADIASLTSFIRSIDNSVVRPSEQENFASALGILDQMESIYQRAKGEGVLTPAARQALQQSINALRENYEAILDGQEQFFIDEAERSGVDPARVVRGVKPPPVQAARPAAPTAPVIPTNNAERQELLQQLLDQNAQMEAQIEALEAQQRGNRSGN